LIVAKIGGSCLNTKDDIRRTIELVEKVEEKPILVVSAFKGVTDELIAQARNALTASFDIKKIEKLHYDFIEDLSPSMKAKTEKRVRALLKELRETLLEVSYRQELSPSNKDRIVSYGEKLVTVVVAAYLTDSGFKAKALWGSDAGIVTNSNFGNASILDESTRLIRERLDTSYVPIVAGFFGKDKEGRIVTLGRGSTDYIATFIAATLNCEVTLFKDVDGLMTADPKIVKTASVIEKINYLDALELACYGSKVIYEKAVIPAMKAHIPIKITNFYSPTRGTTICDEGEATAISSLANVATVNLLGYPNMASLIAPLLLELSALDIHPLLLTKASRDEISMVMKESEAEIAQTTIRKIDKNTNIKVEEEFGLVTAIGSKVREKGTSSVSKFLFSKGIDINAIDRSASGRNLCVLVNKDDVPPATQALHNLFIGQS